MLDLIIISVEQSLLVERLLGVFGRITENCLDI